MAVVTVRMPGELKTAVEMAAAVSRQSMNQWIVDALRREIGLAPVGRPEVRRVPDWHVVLAVSGEDGQEQVAKRVGLADFYRVMLATLAQETADRREARGG